jgi:hypothetical protein
MTTVNISVENDADFYRTFQYITVAGAPIDLTGYSMEMMLRRNASDATALLRLGTDTGEIAIIDAPNGFCTVRITQDVLERLGLGDFDHSNIMTDLTGVSKTKIWSGTLTNVAGATR